MAFTSRRPTTVLIADDEPVIADTLRTILRLNGFEAVATSSGQQAVDAASECHPDIFLTDVVMPDIDGLEAAIKVCAMNPFCRVLLLSAVAEIRDLEFEARKAGHSFEVIEKPIHPTDLVQILRTPRSKAKKDPLGQSNPASRVETE